MREFKIYGEIGENSDTLAFRKVMRNIGEIINNDGELIERAKRANIEFSEEVRKIAENPENTLHLAAMIDGLKARIPRYSFIKNIEIDGNVYEAEIDELERKFYVHKI